MAASLSACAGSTRPLQENCSEIAKCCRTDVANDGAAHDSGFFRELHGLDVLDVQGYLGAECNQPFEESELFVVAADKNVTDTSKRLSESRKIVDAKLFDLVEPFVAKLSEQDPLLTYALVRNDVTEIRYVQGGFFSKHADYLSVTSNVLEEFSFLICITPEKHASPDQGGKTILHMHDLCHASSATTTPGSALAFRKDMQHESTELHAGEKHIIMVNLWAMRKGNDGVLVVHFDAAEDKQSRELDLRQVACGQFYAIPVAEAMRSSRLARHVRSAKTGGGNAIIRYFCGEYDYEAFGTIFRILRRMHVSEAEMQTHAEAIALFGLESQSILPEHDASETQLGGASRNDINIHLLDGSSEAFSVSPSDSLRSLKIQLKARTGKGGLSIFDGDGRLLRDGETMETCGMPVDLFTVKNMTKVDEYQVLALTDEESKNLAIAVDEIEDSGSDVIVCESLARTTVVAQAAMDAKLPYVSFQVLFIEGKLQISGDTCRPCDHRFKMDPAFISVGDCQHILWWGSVADDWDGMNGRWWECSADQRTEGNPVLFDLQRSLHPATQICQVMSNVFGVCLACNDGGDSSDDAGDSSDDGKESNEEPSSIMSLSLPMSAISVGSDVDCSDKFFHINSAGKTSFTAEQAASASARLREILFVEQIKDRLKQVAFELPQSSKARSATLCNERVYGNVNILLVTGVVRLSYEDADAASTAHLQRLREQRLRMDVVSDESDTESD